MTIENAKSWNDNAGGVEWVTMDALRHIFMYNYRERQTERNLAMTFAMKAELVNTTTCPRLAGLGLAKLN